MWADQPTIQVPADWNLWALGILATLVVSIFFLAGICVRAGKIQEQKNKLEELQ